MTVTEAWAKREKIISQLTPRENASWYRLRIHCVPCWHDLPVRLDEWPPAGWMPGWANITGPIRYERIKEQWAEAGELLIEAMTNRVLAEVL